MTGSVVAAFGVTAVYGTSIMFMDMMVFIRMYSQLTFCIVLLSYLFLEYWNRPRDKKFHYGLVLILLLGMLTHYYFLIYAFGFVLLFLGKLKSENQYEDIKKVFIYIGFAGLIYSVIWYNFYIHLFLGHRGRQAIYHAILPKNLVNGPLIMLSYFNEEAFGGFIRLFLVVGIAVLIMKIRRNERMLGYELFLFISALFYLVIVGTIAPFMSSRYVMPIEWIFILTAYVLVRNLAKHFLKHVFVEYLVFAFFAVINLSNFTRYGWRVPNDYAYDVRVDLMKELEGHSAVVYVDDKWKPVIFFEELQHAGDYIFITEDIAKDVFDSMEEDYYILTCVDNGADEKIVEGIDAELVCKYSGRNYYKVVNN